MNIPKMYQDRIEEIYRDDNGYWIYLKKGWRQRDNLCHTLHEDTQQRLLKELRKAIPCDCDDCRK